MSKDEKIDEELKRLDDSQEIPTYYNLRDSRGDSRILSVLALEDTDFEDEPRTFSRSLKSSSKGVLFSESSPSIGTKDVEDIRRETLKKFREKITKRRTYEQQRTDIYFPEDSPFVQTLTNILNSTDAYNEVEIQSIESHGQSRIPVSIVNFTYLENDGSLSEDHIFIKDYKCNETLRRKDSVIPVFMNEIGVTTVSVLGNSPERYEGHKYGLFTMPSSIPKVATQHLGTADLAEVLKRIKNPDIIAKCGDHALEMIATMHVRASKNIYLLKSKYHLELDTTDHSKLIQERLLQYLNTAQPRIKDSFAEAFNHLEKLETGKKEFFIHGDMTPYNTRKGHNLEVYFPIDWELARKDGFATEDTALFILHTLSLRPDRNTLKSTVVSRWEDNYFNTFNKYANIEAPELAISPKDYKNQKMIETLRGHLYKIGDKIWTQDKFGASDKKKFRGQWHMKEILGIFDEHQGFPLMRELKGKTLGLFKNCSNVDYIQTVLPRA